MVQNQSARPLGEGGWMGQPPPTARLCAPEHGQCITCAHTRSHAFTWARRMLTYKARWCIQPRAKAIHVVHVCTHLYTHACLHSVIRVCTYLFRGARVYLCAYVCAHIQARVPTRTHNCVRPRAHSRVRTHARTHAHPRSAPASAGLGTVDKQRLVPIPRLLAWPCILHHTGLPHLDTQPACPSSSHAALWPPFRMGCPAGQGSSSQRDTLERGLHGSGRALGHASMGPGSWNWGQGLRA